MSENVIGKYKQLTLKRIKQQRDSVSELSESWYTLMTPVDNTCHTLYQWRYALIPAIGLGLTSTIKSKPGRMITWSRRVVTLWSAVRIIRRF